MEPLPPLPPLPALPPLPPLPPLPVLAAPFEHDPLPALPPLKLTAWYDLAVSPVHAGNYDLGSDEGLFGVTELPFRQLWDGRE